MFELPECLVLASQITRLVKGRKIARAESKNVEHKFVWHNLPPDEFSRLAEGKTMGGTTVMGRWISVSLDPGRVLLLGECGGALRYEEAGASRPDKRHLLLEFDDGSFLWARTAMWGAYELYEKGEELERQYIKGRRPSPVDSSFTLEYFRSLVAESAAAGRRSAKSLLTQDQLIPGLGNAIAQDILFESRIAPKRDISDIGPSEARALYGAIVGKVKEISGAGGRSDETDLLGRPGRYARLMDKAAAGRPCPRCGGEVSAGQYLGGAIYWCPACQS